MPTQIKPRLQTSGTKSFSYGGYDFGKLLKVALWSGLSAFATVLISSLQSVDWVEVLQNPVHASIAVSVVNTIAFGLKQFFTDTRG